MTIWSMQWNCLKLRDLAPFMKAKRYIQPIPKGREGKNFNKLQTASWFTIEDKLPGEPWTADWGFYS